MKKTNEDVEVAKITSRQAVLVAVITAAAGLTAGYFGKQSAGTDDGGKASAAISALEIRTQSLEKELRESKATAAKSTFDLAALKQRVRDILGPKEDAIREMSRSLDRMKGDIGISQEHRERLATIVQQLDKIDTKVLGIVE